MRALQILDTYPAFAAWWQASAGAAPEALLEGYAAAYLAPWPELLAMQARCHAEDGLDWRAGARERVLPFLAARLPAMERAHAHLVASARAVAARAAGALGYAGELLVVLYVGTGCGAGWATTYAGRPAVLLGLEMIAECGWEEAAALRGLLAHEIAHIWHAALREEAGLGAGAGTWWDLYEEGLAQRGEALALGGASWHMARGQDREWLAWCRDHLAWLAGEYLRRVAAGEDLRPFFGSWYALQGHAQTGYYLGHEAIRLLQREMDLRHIALLPASDVAPALEAVLRRLAAGER